MGEDFSGIIKEIQELKRKSNRNSIAILVVSASICLSAILRFFL